MDHLGLKNILIISLVGGLLNLDTRAVAQVMVSRPIITAPIVGFLIGGWDGIRIGCMIGAILELIWINVLPMGASIPANASLSSTLGVAVALLTKGEMRILIVLAIAISILFSFIFTSIDLKNREFNSLLVRMASCLIHKGRFWAIDAMNLASLLITFLLGIISLFFSLSVSIWLLRGLVDWMPSYMMIGLSIAYYILPILGIGAAVNAFLVSKRLIPYFGVAILWGIIFTSTV